MKMTNDRLRRFSKLVLGAIFVLLAATAQAQTHPNLFRQLPVPAAPGQHGITAQAADFDENLLTGNPAGLTVTLPGKPDLIVERETHQRRGPRSMVWRGRSLLDRRSTATLTLYEGLLYGRIESANDIYAVRPGANGRAVIEKINSESFDPEWGHDAATHGHEKVPPASGGDSGQQGASSAPASSAADGTTQIVLMSVYTPQARAAAGGTTQIQAQIQAAVDQANTAFTNSNMIARFYLAHSEEVTYNDSGNIETDLNWVTSNATVASLRNTFSADMVSLITSNGGGYCGIGWVQRHPGSSFAGYAFQVTARNCLSNSTLAHEHGHNMGMEHDPASAGVSPSGASYPWSFGHYVNGAFRTVMSYDVCTISCPRVLNFSNPEILYNGIATGIANQRDNAYTGDLTAPIVANFRLGGGSGVNNPPAFTSDPIVKSNASQGQAYSGSIAGNASDPDSDPLTFAKTGGPTWLNVASSGGLSGTPGAADVGVNYFTVSVSDGRGGSDTTTLQITVVATLSAPTNLVATSTVGKRIDLNWTDNSAGEAGFKIERSTNGKSYSQIATVGANATTFANTGLRSGRKYYYRVRAYSGTSNSPYSNTVNTIAK
jgi:peptidyl-Asp metalloendopeptidase